MLPACRSATRIALLAFAPGCSGSQAPEPVLYPVLSERGHLTYRTNDPRAPSAPPTEKERWDKELRRQAQAQLDREQRRPVWQPVVQGEFVRAEQPEPRPGPRDFQLDPPDPGPSTVYERLAQQRQEASERQQWEQEARERQRQEDEMRSQQRLREMEAAHQEQLRQQAETQRLHEQNQRMHNQSTGAPY
jgi:hypothetical protein